MSKTDAQPHRQSMMEQSKTSKFKEIQIPNQKHINSLPWPFVLSPNTSTCDQLQPCLTNFIDSIKAEKPHLEAILGESGAILFRGFPVRTASEFNEVVLAFGYEEFPYVGGAALRTQVVDRVYTANESPLHRSIGFHNEMSQSPDFPSKLMFFCEVAPVNGGETPLVAGGTAYDRVKKKHPDFVQQLDDRGLIYCVVIGDEDDPNNPIGRGWKSQFATNDKRVAEERASKIGLELEWVENGVKAKRGPSPGILFDAPRGRNVWFNSISVVHTILEDDPRNEQGLSITFGDGSPLPPEVVSDCMAILEEESFAFPWQEGDILLIDNAAVLHGRRPCVPPRRVLASLCK